MSDEVIATQRVSCKDLFATQWMFLFFAWNATHCGLMGGMSENEGRLSQRHSQLILDDLKRVADESGISQVALVAAAIRGLAKTWKEEKELSFPFRVVPESRFKALTEGSKKGK